MRKRELNKSLSGAGDRIQPLSSCSASPGGFHLLLLKLICLLLLDFLHFPECRSLAPSGRRERVHFSSDFRSSWREAEPEPQLGDFPAERKEARDLFYSNRNLSCSCIAFWSVSCSCGCRTGSLCSPLMDFSLLCRVSEQNGGCRKKPSLFDGEDLTPHLTFTVNGSDQ